MKRKTKKIIYIFLLLLFILIFIGCAPDKQEINRDFNDTQLIPQHRLLLREAARQIESKYPTSGSFIFSDSGESYIIYGDPEVKDAAASTRWTGISWLIIFRPLSQFFVLEELYILTAHELCHTIELNHSTGNPNPGSCVSSKDR